MKTQLMVAAALLAAAGFGCQRTYENRYDTPDRRAQAEPIEQAPAAVETQEPAFGERGQSADINGTQDLATDDTAAAYEYGMDEQSGMGGSGVGGSPKPDAGMMKPDAGTSKLMIK